MNKILALAYRLKQTTLGFNDGLTIALLKIAGIDLRGLVLH